MIKVQEIFSDQWSGRIACEYSKAYDGLLLEYVITVLEKLFVGRLRQLVNPNDELCQFLPEIRQRLWSSREPLKDLGQSLNKGCKTSANTNMSR